MLDYCNYALQVCTIILNFAALYALHSFRNIRYYNVLNNRIRELCGATKLDTIRNEIIRDNESGGNVQESPRKKVEVVIGREEQWAPYVGMRGTYF